MSQLRACTSISRRALRSKLDGSEALLDSVVRERTVEARLDVLRQGEVPAAAHVLLDGHTCRYRLLSDGRRQITAVLVPGDMCDLEAVMRGRADYGVVALTACILGEIPAERIADPTSLCPEMSRALWRRLLRDEAISREWLVGIGRRTALERVAHLLCELRVRVNAIGLAVAEEFDMQFTQVEFADILGMSTGHINRVFKQLCRTGLIDLSRGFITVLDMPTMELVAGFDPTYLQLSDISSPSIV